MKVMAQGAEAGNPCLTAFLERRSIDALSRGFLVELVSAVYIHKDKSIEIEFNFSDQYRRIAERIENGQTSSA